MFYESPTVKKINYIINLFEGRIIFLKSGRELQLVMKSSNSVKEAWQLSLEGRDKRISVGNIKAK